MCTADQRQSQSTRLIPRPQGASSTPDGFHASHSIRYSMFTRSVLCHDIGWVCLEAIKGFCWFQRQKSDHVSSSAGFYDLIVMWCQHCYCMYMFRYMVTVQAIRVLRTSQHHCCTTGIQLSCQFKGPAGRSSKGNKKVWMLVQLVELQMVLQTLSLYMATCRMHKQLQCCPHQSTPFLQ